MQTLILLEQDEKIVSDVKCSLDLIGVSIAHAEDLNSCKQAISEHTPPLILARIGKQIDDRETLIKSIGEGGRLYGVPVTALGTETELLACKDAGLSAFAELKLPVEFPQFTYEVQRIMADALGSVQEKPVENLVQESEVSSKEDQVLNLNHKYALLFKLQNQVMMGLSENGVIDNTDEKDIPRILSEETRRVCEKFAVYGDNKES